MTVPVMKRPGRLNKSAFFDDLKYKPHRGQRNVHESHASRRIHIRRIERIVHTSR